MPSNSVDFPSANNDNRPTNMASTDADDDIIISSASLIVSSLYQRRQVNVRKRKRNLWARKWIAKCGDCGAYNDLVRGIREIDSVS